MSPNMRALLASIAWAEGADYNTIVTGIGGKPETFTDFSTHPFVHRPAKLINSRGLKSTASGRYQILLANWLHYAPLLGLKDFGPASQDAIAVQMISEKGAIASIEAGDFATAILRIKKLWASLPGAGYAGQPEKPYLQLLATYKQAGGAVRA